MPETAEYLLAQACLCRRFADEVRSNKTANGLRDLAHEYDARAKRLVAECLAYELCEKP